MRIWKYLLSLMVLVVACVWLAVFSSPDSNLHLTACSVGEGDAILISYKNLQILVDGGSDNRVLDCLGRHLPFWDREIEAVILTHPDKDHYAGLIEVVRRYKVNSFLYNEANIGSSSYEVLTKEVGSRGVRTITAEVGTKLRGGKIYLEVVSPQEAVAGGESNDNSLVIILTYGNFEAVLTGDAPKEILNQVLPERKVEYIKISHHGSKTGTDATLLKRIMPSLAVISVGKNSYGHPSEEVLKLLNNQVTKVLRTDLSGDIEVISNGSSFWVSK